MQRESTREKSLLDLFITNRPSLVKSISTTPNISDYDAAIVVDSAIYPITTQKVPRKVYIFSKANWPEMRNEALDFNNDYLLHHESRTVNENWTHLKDTLNHLLNTHVPSKLQKNKTQPPWLTNELRRKTNKKHRLYKKAKRSQNVKQLARFKSYKKSVQKEITRARNKYINENIVGGLKEGNTKPFYKYIKSMKKDNVGLAPLKSGSSLLTNASEKGDILLQEFSGVFTKEDTSSIPWLGPAKEKMPEIKISSDGILKLLHVIKPHKASGPDRIPNRLLKELASELAPIMAALFNQSLSTGEVPDDWSNALISPVFKKGNVHLASNYRPVSLTSVACKLLEHVICSHIHAHLEQHGLLTPVQHGFRKAHSCETQLLVTMDDFFSAFDAKIQTDVGILDFSRAFDTVPHQRLMGKLAHYGIQGTTIRWIEAFLCNRRMQVVVDGETTGPAPVVSGVPQGTVLGPLLFNIYINDMPQTVTEGTSIRLFADDCLVYRRIESPEDQQILQNDLHNLQQWAERWGMRFNASKCNIMHIARPRIKTLNKYYELCNQILDTVDSAKYLGIIISKDLEWHTQICSVVSKATSTLHLIARNLRQCPRSTRALAYTTLVRPKLEYCASVWDPHKVDDINRLERVNRRAARVVYNKSMRQQDVSPTAIINDLGWTPLSERRKRHRLCILYKICWGLVAVPPTRLQKPNRQTRGHTQKLNVLTSTCDSVKNSFYVRTIPEWNNLTEETVNAKNLQSFKSLLDRNN